MRSVSIIIGRLTHMVGLILLFVLSASAQVNSPFSRYGIGNLTGSQHIISRGMGGLQAAYADGQNNNIGQSVNFNNPATYGSFYMISYDLGLSIDSRNLKSTNPNGSFSSIYFIPSYVAIGIPLNKAKGLGAAFGLRPMSRVNYSVISTERIAGDSVGTNYQGAGGLNQAFIGIGKKWKKFSIGANTGYNFGRKEITTQKTFFNDTAKYYQSNSISQTNFGKMFVQLGFQYEFTLKKKDNTAQKSTENYLLRIGATATLQQKLNATQKITRQTFGLGASGNIIEIDSVFKQDDIMGKIAIPAIYEAGLVFHKTLNSNRGVFELWSIGVEYNYTQWSKYRFYEQPDALSNSWMLKFGAQLSPNPLSTGNYLSNVNYRIGFQMGKDYINADGKGLKTAGFSIGAGFPIRKWRAYETQYTVIQTALQFGKRGSSVNNFTENYAQFSLGFSLSDIWFIKRKYD